MSLYNQCLVSVVLNGGYKTDDLVHTIRADIDALQCLKKKLDEWNVTMILLTQIQERIEYYCNYRYCDCEIPINCECTVYFNYYYANSDEQERARLDKEVENVRIMDEHMKRLSLEGKDLEIKCFNKKKEIRHAKDKIPSRLQRVARKIVRKMDDYLIVDWEFNLFRYTYQLSSTD